MHKTECCSSSRSQYTIATAPLLIDFKPARCVRVVVGRVVYDDLTRLGSSAWVRTAGVMLGVRVRGLRTGSSGGGVAVGNPRRARVLRSLMDAVHNVGREGRDRVDNVGDIQEGPGVGANVATEAQGLVRVVQHLVFAVAAELVCKLADAALENGAQPHGGESLLLVDELEDVAQWQGVCGFNGR